ncbi:hypothetical protein L9F63_011302, partial [Diploptera punctata]
EKIEEIRTGFQRSQQKSDPDIILVSPSGVGGNVVGCFRLFSHWRVPILFLFLPRKSWKMLWDVFASSPTGGSRYSSCFSLGSRGKCCGMFSPLLPLEDPDIILVSPSGSGKMLWDVFASSPTGGSRYSSCFSLGSRGKCCGMFSPLLPLEVGENAGCGECYVALSSVGGV